MSASDSTPAWRQRAVLRGLTAARSRAEKRVQRYMDAAFELMDEKSSTEFTIQEVIERSGQSLRGFYQYFDGKGELLLALFEQSVAEAISDLEAAGSADQDPLAALRAFTVRLHEWCEPTRGSRGSHNRVPVSEFSLQLTMTEPERVREAMAPIYEMLAGRIQAAAEAGRLRVGDFGVAALLVQQTVMCSWITNRLVGNPGSRITAEQTWEFCARALSADES